LRFCLNSHAQENLELYIDFSVRMIDSCDSHAQGLSKEIGVVVKASLFTFCLLSSMHVKPSDNYKDDVVNTKGSKVLPYFFLNF
jgi:hypothetical protein